MGSSVVVNHLYNDVVFLNRKVFFAEMSHWDDVNDLLSELQEQRCKYNIVS